jgi:hypothetical protein
MTDLQILIGNKMTNSQIRNTTVQLMSYNCKKHNIKCVEMHLLEIKFKASCKSNTLLVSLSLTFPTVMQNVLFIQVLLYPSQSAISGHGLLKLHSY